MLGAIRKFFVDKASGVVQLNVSKGEIIGVRVEQTL